MPKRKKRRRPNWPYRWTVFVLGLLLVVYLAIQTAIGAVVSIQRVGHIDWFLPLVAASLDATVAVWFVAVGACVGSFLNVVAYRLPLGRTVGGHSGCPYCQVPIESRDNVPVLGWIKLRGRCRTCRLPISPQYPLVELSVALIFLFVYLTEFRIGGANLPGSTPQFNGGVYGLQVTPFLLMRTISYLVCLSGLIGAALIANHRSAVSLKLYLWSVAPLAIVCLISPDIPPIPWREALPGMAASGPIDTRMDALTTLLCGLVGGIALGRMLSPLLHPSFDRTFISRDKETNSARNFVGSCGLVGLVLGWQAVIGFAWVLLLLAIAATILTRWLLGQISSKSIQAAFCSIRDLTVWTWLGLAVYRAFWELFNGFQLLPNTLPMVFRYLIALVALAPLARAYVLITPIDPSVPPENDSGNQQADADLIGIED